MLNFYKFWQTASAEGFSLDDVPLALRDAIEYTFEDFVRVADIRYNDGSDWVTGYQQPMFFASAEQTNVHNQAYCITVNDGTSSKLGLVIMTANSEYERYHNLLEQPGMREAVAHAFGYGDAVLITDGIANVRVHVGSGPSDYRGCHVIPTYSTLYVSDTNWRAVAAADKPAVTTVLGAAFPGNDATKRSPFCMQYTTSTMLIAAPLEHYNTDAENVATLNSKCDAILEQRVKDNANSASSAIATEETRAKYVEDAIMDAVEAMPVFGMTLISAVQNANNMRDAQQYIPRP